MSGYWSLMEGGTLYMRSARCAPIPGAQFASGSYCEALKLVCVDPTLMDRGIVRAHIRRWKPYDWSISFDRPIPSAEPQAWSPSGP